MRKWFSEVAMKRITFFIFVIFLFLFPINNSKTAVMEDYCQVPPYVIQDVPPNVMIVLDNSGSMFYFSYFDGFNTTTTTDDNLCADSANPCTGFTAPGTYPTYKYYGYFNPDYWYTYSSNRFVPAARKTETRPASSWDGNFLNWLTMRRLDVIRKVMTGGRKTTGEGSGYDRLIGEIADCDGRGKYKRINNAQDYTPYSGNRKFYVYSANAGCGGGGSGTSYFGVRNASDGSDGTGNETTLNVAVRVPTPVEGVLQEVVGTRARLGLSFYRVNSPTPHGGFVRVPVAGGSLSSTVNEINLTRPNSNTPLAETLWTVTGYFAQQATIEGGPGPRYNSGDFQINNNNDPYNYGTGGLPRWPSCSKSFVLYITDGEPCADGYLPTNLRDYASGRSDYNCSGTSCPAVGSFPASTFPSCYGGGESTSCNGVVSGCYVAGIEDVALWAHTKDLRNSPTLGVNNMTGIQNLTLYAIFAFGKGSTLLRYAAINGGFEDINGSNTPDLQSEWDGNGDGEPDNFYEADEGYALEQAIRNALSAILKRAASGTAASVLASGEGSGANLIQAIFYPRRRFGNDIIAWTGENQNYWYYVDPDFEYSSIREDTVSDQILHLVDDYLVRLYFDQTAQLTKAARFQDTDGDGDADTTMSTVLLENVSTLWRAGELLWSRDITADPRTIYTTCISGTTCIGTTNLTTFSTTNRSALRPYLQAVDDIDAEYIIRYIHGEGLTTLYDEDGNVLISGIDRKGTCSLTTSTSCTIDSECPSGETCVPDGIDDYRPRYARIGSDVHVWKLGDILNSTPKIASWLPLNDYDKVYKDKTYGPRPDSYPLNTDTPDPNYYITTTGYKSRGMVFAGGNDGMLHAFKLGKLELRWSTQGTHEVARLLGTNIGKEVWAFVPKNALPYLKYFANPEYCHVYTVDLTPFIFDASINGAPDDIKTVSSWRTILVVGMRLGGACRKTGDSCTDCVKTPLLDPSDSSKGLGYSSYFALDITDTLADPTNPPVLLWEFSNANIPAAELATGGLGFATTGPAVVKIVSDTTKNGKWFVVLGSGPTGPIDTSNWQFLGRSDQRLKFFILDLKTGSLLRTIDTGIDYAFASSMFNSTYDHKLDNYQDDAIYVGYVKRTGTSPNYTWTDGGVGRLTTHDITTGTESSDVSKWAWSTVMDGIGPVTSSVTHLYNTRAKKSWLYFGTGRYFFEQGTSADDPNSQRRLFGIKEPCVNSNGIFDLSSCTTVAFGTLDNRTTLPAICISDPKNCPEPNTGWYIDLDPSTTSGTPLYYAERVITDPLASPSLETVFFTTYKPYNDECGLGGKSFIWAVRYKSGGPAVGLKGKALLQVSTGSIEQVDLSTAFTEKEGRRTSGMEGVPPTAQGLTVMGYPDPVRRILHIRER
jgi:type IV pilus assembly protein PilY1